MRASGRLVPFWGGRPAGSPPPPGEMHASRPCAPREAPLRPAPWLDRGLSLVPLLFAVPVLAGIGLTLASLLATDYPDPGPGQQVNTDAAALYLGQPLYQDPAEGYTGILYTPVLPLLVSVAYRASMWPGWPVLAAVLSSLVMVGVAARVAWSPRSPRAADRALAALEALGVGALAWALVSCVQFNGLYGGSGLHDGVAWVPALVGLVLLPAAAGGSRRSMALLVLLLSVAFWTKQNTIAASLAAVLWLGVAAAVRVVPRRRALGIAVTLLGLNAVVLGAANLLSSGWEFHFNFGVPGAHPLGELGGNFPYNFPRFLREDLLPATGLSLAFVAAMWAAAWRGSSGRRGAERDSRGLRGLASAVAAQARRPAVLTASAAITLLAALAYRRAGALNLYFLTAPSERLQRFVDSVLTPAVVLALVFAGCLLAAALARRAGSGALRRRLGAFGPWMRGASDEDRLATVLWAVLVVGLLTAFYFRQKKGADDHYYIGMAWALALLGALGYRRVRARAGTAAVAGTAVALLFLATLVVGPTRQDDARRNAVNLPSLARVTEDGRHPEHEEWLTVFFPAQGLLPVRRFSDQVDPELRAYARAHPVWHLELGDINVAARGAVWPSFDNIYGQVAAGEQPRHLVDAWLDRHFDAVSYPLPTTEDRELANYSEGRLEESYLWKLNQVLAARYEASPEVPEGLFARRPGPDRAPWMRGCFGPFAMAGASFSINHGGGFWCRSGTEPSLTLRRTPAAWSDVRTDEPVTRAAGALTATLPRRAGSLEVMLEPEDGEAVRLRMRRGQGGGTSLEAFRGSTLTGRAEVSAGRNAPGRVTLTLAAGGGDRMEIKPEAQGRVTLRVPDLGEGAVLRLGASRGSGASFDLGGLELE